MLSVKRFGGTASAVAGVLSIANATSENSIDAAQWQSSVAVDEPHADEGRTDPMVQVALRQVVTRPTLTDSDHL